MASLYNLTSFYIVRHGQSKWNKKGLLQGQANPPLSEVGKKQAIRLACVIKKLPINIIYTSDLLRAQETASIIAKESNLPIYTSSSLREQYLGLFEGKPYSFWNEQYNKISNKYFALSDEKKLLFKLSEDMESDKEAIERFISFLREISNRHKNKNILIVTHGSILRYFLISIGFGTYEEISVDAVENTAYLHVVLKANKFRLKYLSGVTISKKRPFPYARK